MVDKKILDWGLGLGSCLLGSQEKCGGGGYFSTDSVEK
jgi:hypothetical protein